LQSADERLCARPAARGFARSCRDEGDQED
jgi:hypothetical protein